MARITDLIQKVAEGTAQVVGRPTASVEQPEPDQAEKDRLAREEAARRGVKRA